MKKLIFATIFLTLALFATAAVLKCSVCGSYITGNYLKSGSQIFCTKSCADSLAPKCRGCGIAISGRYVIYYTDRENPYCKDCSQKAICFACKLPASGAFKLPDARIVCRDCRAGAITTTQHGRTYYQSVGLQMAKLGFPHCKEVVFHVSDRPGMQKVLGDKFKDNELGVYHCQWTEQVTKSTKKAKSTKEIIDQECSIYIYDYLPADLFAMTVAHEIAHDWMRHNYPNITKPLIAEGFAEFASGLYNTSINKASNNLRMEKNPDKIYGDGYRMFQKLYERGGMKAVIQYLERENKR